MLTNILFTLLGIVFGFSISAALFALITSIGIVTRLADKTRTASYIKSYEGAILLGGGIGNAFYVCDFQLYLPSILLLFIGIFFGMYVGCLATALAESLKVTTVFNRRLKIHYGIGFMVLFTALGKCLGSFIYFFFNFY